MAGSKKIKSPGGGGVGGGASAVPAAPAAPPPVLEDISLRDLPEFVDRQKPSGDFRDFVLDLTEDGQAKAGKIIEEAAAAGNRKAKRQKTENPTTICLLCVDSGSPLEACFFHHKGNGGNKKKHYRNVHVEKKQLVDGEGYVFKRITELKGKLVGKADRNASSVTSRYGFVGSHSLVETSPGDFQKALAAWACATNQSVDVIEHPTFRKLLATASGVRTASTFQVTKEVVKAKIVELSEKLKKDLERQVSSLSMDQYRLFLMVGKDTDGKLLRACLTFISDDDPSNLDFSVLPIPLGIESPDRNNIAEALTQAMKKIDVNLELSALGGVRNCDGADDFVLESLGRPTIEHLSPGKAWDDFDKTKSHGCFDQLANQVILGSLGLMDNKEVAANPPDSVSQAVRSATQGASTWSSVMSRISETLLGVETATGPLMVQKKLLAEVQAILDPLASLTGALTRDPSKPSGAVTLAAIALLLLRYGCEFSQGLMYPDSIRLREDSAWKETKFEVVDPKNHAGPKKIVPLRDFSGAGLTFFRGFMQHLIYRFCTKRGNRSFYEVLGLMVDPVMLKYGELVFGKGPGEWNFESIQTHVNSVVAKMDPSSSSSTSTSASRLDVPTESLGDLKSFIETYDKAYNPLEFWSNDDMQTKYPGLYNVNLVTLAYSSNSAVVTSSGLRNPSSPGLRYASFLVKHASKSLIEGQ